MTRGRTVFVWVMILASLTFVTTEEGSRSDSQSETNERMSFALPSFGMNYNLGGVSGGLPNFLGGSGNGSSNPFSQFLTAFSQFFPGMNGLPSASGMGSASVSRLARDVNSQNSKEVEQDGHLERQDRLSMAIPISCNYTNQPGASCAGCASRLICLRGDRGYLQGCSVRQPYCNRGRCSTNPSAVCFSSSTSTTAKPGV